MILAAVTESVERVRVSIADVMILAVITLSLAIARVSTAAVISLTLVTESAASFDVSTDPGATDPLTYSWVYPGIYRSDKSIARAIIFDRIGLTGP